MAQTYPVQPNNLGFLNTITGVLSTSKTNTTNAPHVVILGDYNINTNSWNHIMGVNNLVGGPLNQVIGVNNIVSGNNNIVLGNSQSVVFVNSLSIGNNNIVISSTQSATASNGVPNGVFLFGSNNTIGPSVSNVFVIGDNITPTQSNTIQLGNSQSTIIIPTGATISVLSSTPETMAYFDSSGNLNSIFTVNESIYSFAEGNLNLASGLDSHAEGSQTIASGTCSHTEGFGGSASGPSSHSEGNTTSALGDSSHAEGSVTIAYGDYSHAEGFFTLTSQSYAHAEGSSTIASGQASHAEGNSTIASGPYSHAEGISSIASGDFSHAEGNTTSALGDSSHAGGGGAISSHFAEWSRGALAGSQYGILCWTGQTTNTSPTEIFLDNGTARFTIATGSVYSILNGGAQLAFSEGFSGNGMVKKAGDASTFASFDFPGFIVYNNAGKIGFTSSQLINPTSYTYLYNNGSETMEFLTASFVLDNVNQSLNLTVQAPSTSTFNWFYYLEYNLISV